MVDRAALSITDLHVGYSSHDGRLPAVRGIDLSVAPGERVGLIGESGSGKTTLVAALMGMLPDTAHVSGTLAIGDAGVDIGADRTSGDHRWRKVRGRRLAAVPQGAMAGLHPTHRVDAAVAEVMMVHAEDGERGDKAEVLNRSQNLLAEVGLDERARRAFPHELSGGMRQRVALAAALACRPDVLIADEPTVGLDVVIAAQFVELLLERQRSDGFGLLIVSHDLMTVRRATDRLLVMYAGRIVESVSTADATDAALHPYAQGLFAAAPSFGSRTWAAIPGTAPGLLDMGDECAFSARCPHADETCRSAPPSPTAFGSEFVECHLYPPDRVAAMDRTEARVTTTFPTVKRRPSPPGSGDAVVTVRGLGKTFESRRWFTAKTTRALIDIDLDVAAGEIVGIVGVSGSGKSTLARSLFGLVLPESGTIVVDDRQLVGASRKQLRQLRRRIAFVHQDPYGSLHPAMSIADLVAEPLVINRVGRNDRKQRVAEALELVGLGNDEQLLSRRAGQLSGGQRQRVAIARGLVSEPVLMVLDEPMSMLDASVRAGIASALLDIRDVMGVAAVVITHDLAEAAAICDRIVVLDGGRVVEQGPTGEIVDNPQHEATQRLFRLAGVDPVAEPTMNHERSHG